MLNGEDEFNAKKRSKFQKRLKEIEGFEIEIQQELMKFHTKSINNLPDLTEVARNIGSELSKQTGFKIRLSVPEPEVQKEG